MSASPGLQVAAVGRWACVFFLHTSSCNCPRKPCGDKALKARAPSEGVPHAMAGFVQSLLAALGSGLLQAPLFCFFASCLALFHRSHTKETASSCTAVDLSATLCIFAHAPLFPANFHFCCPPAGLGVRLFRGTGAGLRRPLMCCMHLRSSS